MKVKFLFLLIPLATVVAMLLLLPGAGDSQAVTAVRVSLKERVEVTPVQQISGCTFGHHGGSSLRVAIAGVLSPGKTLDDYQELLTYMSQQLDRQVTFILKPTYAEINALIRGEYVQWGFICSLAYVIGKEDFGMELLVAPQVRGETIYYSYLIVPAESSAEKLEQLRGASFAFTDPLSNSGHLVPTYHLALLGESPVSFFSRYIFTYSHDNSILAVADKLVDGAAVDSLVYDKLIANHPGIASRTRIIAIWGPYGIPPVVVGPSLDPELKQQLRHFFLDLHNSAEGRQVLNNLGIDRFVVVPDSNYDSIREMKTKLGW